MKELVSPHAFCPHGKYLQIKHESIKLIFSFNLGNPSRDENGYSQAK